MLDVHTRRSELIHVQVTTAFMSEIMHSLMSLPEINVKRIFHIVKEH